MSYRKPLIAALLAAAAAAGWGVAAAANAPAASGDAAAAAGETASAAQNPSATMPRRGMTMDSVAKRFGDPLKKMPAVGKPPITRWQYPGYIVYFEDQYVIDSVVAS